MSSTTIQFREQSRSSESASRVPPLQNGDRLTAAEFECRFDAVPGLKRAELINGVVYMPPPFTDGSHAEPHFLFSGVLTTYAFSTPGVTGGIEGTLRLDARNRPQPDLYLRIDPECGGQSVRDRDGYVTGGPDLVVEIAATSAGFDLHDKLSLYEAYQVHEYAVWRTFDGALDYLTLESGVYQRVSPRTPMESFAVGRFPVCGSTLLLFSRKIDRDSCRPCGKDWLRLSTKSSYDAWRWPATPRSEVRAVGTPFR